MKRLLAAASLVATLAAVGAGTASASHSWSTYHWARTSNPFTVQVGNNLTGDWSQYLTNASNDWNSTQQSVLRNTVVPGQAGKRCKATAGRVEVCNSTYGNNGWLGVASISLSGGHIAQGTVKLNDTYFNTSTYNNPNEKNHVVCQEVGHTWGLDHQDTSGAAYYTCMDYFSNTGANAGSTVSTTPDQGDYDQLTCIYDPASAGKTLSSNTNGINHSCTGTGHLDSTTTVGAAAGFLPAADEVPWWANRNESVYVQKLPNGITQVSYVLWAVAL